MEQVKVELPIDTWIEMQELHNMYEELKLDSETVEDFIGRIEETI